MNEDHTGPIQAGEQSLDMVTDSETEDENTGSLRGIDSLGPVACFDQGLVQTGQSAPFGHQTDGGTIGGRLKGDRTSIRLLDLRGNLRCGHGETGEISCESLAVMRRGPGAVGM